MADQVLVQVLNGVSISMILILVAAGLAIIFGLMGVINLAHGEFFMLGAYTVLVVHSVVPSPWIGMILAPFVIGLLGLVLEYTLVRRLYEQPMVTLLATWGVSIVLRQLTRLVFGAGHKNVPNPLPGTLTLLSIDYPAYRLFIIAVTIIILGFVLWLLLRTDFGLQVRAVIQNRSMAAALGINVQRIDMLVFSLGAALAGLAGGIMSPMITVNPEMGLDYLARSFLVVIVGGVGQLFGVVVGGVTIGGLDALLSFFVRPVWAQIILFIVSILLIRLWPQGLISRG